MQSWYDAHFDREMGCTEAELRRWLPGAAGPHPLRLHETSATFDVDGGRLELRWSAMPARQIALIRMPRLHVEFRFEAVEEAARQRFMRHFDLYTQRGGG
jgi:hypothetical protein